MKRFSSSSTGALGSVIEQVSSGLVKVKSTLRHIPVVGRLFRKNLKNLPLQIGRATHIIITSLSYPGMYHAGDDTCMELRGTKYDFVLLLRHFDYRHENNSIKFTLLNDFEVDFTDSTGVQRVIPRADTSRNSVRCRIQAIMRSAEPDDKIVFFFGGHGEYAEVDMMGKFTAR
ncbi:hypothetical protein M407DRAFT_31704 [Tulasnella calospora MUT 4182]|uniref:Uncharacterized protein n=1 Tax=Tulasnella calospora MUT 4182 TaxID=1051891 RepID=A0A0C3KB27_9AGAM|nr:hypothetical protein M407DRAFT_31704 [Tulasnella calospora MUT 4182]